MVDFANSEFYSANVSTLTTDFNVTPYYDDYDASTEYYRILFKPGFAVQARELTQIQSMLQEQINRFGQHVFKEGSKVLGGQFTINKNTPYVKVLDSDILGNEVNIANFKDQIVTGQTTGIQAYVNLVIDGVETSQNTKTLYVTYKSSNLDTGETVFTTNETLISNVGTLITVSQNATGLGSVFSINEGVRFAKNHFIHHNKDSIVIDRYGTSPTCKVGFYISEDIINASQDSSLLDPALESSNFSAPGADRLKLTPELQRVEYNDVVGPPNYVNLFNIVDGVVQEINERPIYNVVADEIAKRTSDESGDYYVSGLNVQLLENLKTANNGGLLSLSEGGNSALLSVMVEPGVAYVKGYEINSLVSKYITTEKSTSYNNINSQIVTSKLGSYVTINEAVGSWNLDKGQQILLYDTAQKRISTHSGSTAAQTGKQIGTARVKSITFDSGTLGTPSANLKLHLFDIQMLGSNSFSNVNSVFYNNGGSSANICADIVLNSVGKCSLNEQQSSLLYPVGSFVKTIRSSDGSVDTTFTFKRTSQVSIASGGTFTVSGTITNEIFPYGSGTLGDSDKTDIFLTLNESFNIALPGTALSGGGTSNTITGSGTTKFTRLNVGDRIELSNNTKTYIVTSIANDTSLTVSTTLPTINGNTIFKAYKTGDMIDMRGVGVDAGTTRTITSTSSSLAFDLKETFGGTKSGTVSYNVSRTSAREIAKTLKTNRFVKINVGAAGTTTGPFNLGFSDVYRIRNIILKTGSAPTSLTDGTNVTTKFLFDSGQRNDYYGLGSIVPNDITLGVTDYLLVELDYFLPDFTLGVGYFSVDSYPVNDSSPTVSQITTPEIPIYNGIDLRNVIDFRPVYNNTALDATVVAGASTNPSSSTTVDYDAAGLRMPAESEQIIFDYSYYLARIDTVVLDITGKFSVVKGVPSIYPVSPTVPVEYMSCAKLYISPYPSIAPAYAIYLGRQDLSCGVTRTSNIRYTMRDIGILKRRIDNLEQFVSLNLLEKNTLDMKILDENGLDRFKNGIFADDFRDRNLSSFADIDCHISFDFKNSSIRPIFETQALSYDYLTGTNVVLVGDYMMLPYNEVTLINQPHSTTIRNVETTVYKFIGKLYIDPETDFWTNTSRIAGQTLFYADPKLDYIPYSVSYGSWQTVTGSSINDPSVIYVGGGRFSDFSTIPSNWNLNQPSWVIDAVNSLGIAPIQSGAYLRGVAGVPTNAATNAINAGQGGTGIINYLKSIDPKSVTSTTVVQQIGGYFGVPGTYSGLSYNWGSSQSDIARITREDGYAAQRNITETFQYLADDKISLGDKVVDVSLISDIRPQIIRFEGRGLKANTRHYIYFDGQLMSDYVTPGQRSDYLTYDPNTAEANTNGTLIVPKTGAKEGDPIYTDSNGVVFGLIRIPSDASKTFRVGSKEINITDNPTNEPEFTSFAKTYFVSYGINQTKQEQIIATKQVVTQTKVSTEQKTVAGGIKVEIYDAASCMAYSFIPKVDDAIEGIFLTSVDVYFAAKDPNLSVNFEIRAMDNAGNITRTQVPMSEVWLPSSKINVSDDGSVPTNVKFKTPVFLKNNVEYAFVIHTEGINPNYYMHVSVLGENDVITKLPVNQRGLTGTLYTTNNNLDWDIVPKTDLKIRFNRASFSTGVQGSGYLGNEPFEYLVANTIPTIPSYNGEKFNGNDILLLTAPVGGSISVGDLLIGANSGVNTSVVSITGSSYRMANTGYLDGETLNVANANGTLIGVTSTVSSKNTASGYLYSYLKLYNKDKIVLSSSNGKFFTGDTMRGSISGENFVVESIDKFPYSTVQFEPSYLNFNSTTCSFDMLTTSNSGSPGIYEAIRPGIITDFFDEKALFSKTTENNTLGDNSNKIKVNMSSTSEYLSPVVDVVRTYNVYVHNIVDSNTASETSSTSNGGGLKNKYISQVVTLAENQDSEDLRIMITAYRPSGSNSDIKVYTRLSHAEDFEPITNRNWIELDYYDGSVYSSLTNRGDAKEYTFSLPTNILTGTIDTTANVAQYTNSVGTTFTGFRQFQIKIGLQSDNSAVFPRVFDVRAIALMK